MKNQLRALEALPIFGLGRHAEIILVAVIAAVVGMMILPLPPLLMDGLLAANLALGALVLTATLLSERPLSLSTFPTLLLITTLYRLALNVSTTRLILSTGNAGEVVKAFGAFVIRGDVVVGLVLFLVITLVQFLVIAKGAERVAEVGARFTLDAMPGKQMSIDAALRSGAVDEDEAQARRDTLGRESQFYGAMDGAMKFVKGDAVAGLIITGLNLVAGLAIGVGRFDLGFSEAARTYAVLTVGDGLLAQIPALLVTLAAGVITTRVAGAAQGNSDLAAGLRSELFGRPKVLLVAAAFALVLGLIPGLPLLPFGTIAFGLLLVAKGAAMASVDGSGESDGFEARLQQSVRKAQGQRALCDDVAPAVVPVGLDLDPDLSAILGFDGQADESTELLGQLIPQLRDALFMESGVRFAGVRVRARVPGLPRGGFVVRIKDVPVARGVVPGDKALALERPDRLAGLAVQAEATRHPLHGGEVSLIPAEQAAVVQASGVPVWTAAGIVALQLAAVLRRKAREFVGLQEVADSIERLQKVYPTLVKEVVPKVVSLPQIVDVLRRLVDEGISIRDLKSILESLAEHGPYENDGVALTELVRASLSSQLGHAYATEAGELSAVLLDPVIEDTVRGAITHVSGGSYLALEPDLRTGILRSIVEAIQPVAEAGLRPVVLTSAEIRRYVRKLLEEVLPEVVVLSFQELPGDLTVRPLGRVSAERALAS